VSRLTDRAVMGGSGASEDAREGAYVPAVYVFNHVIKNQDVDARQRVFSLPIFDLFEL